MPGTDKPTKKALEMAQRFIDTFCMDEAVVMNVECNDYLVHGIAQFIDDARRDEREACCRLVCSHCRRWVSFKIAENGIAYHPDAGNRPCSAHKLRSLSGEKGGG
jgi:hypothetical protein